MDQRTIQTYNQLVEEYDNETINFWDKFPRTFFDKFAKFVKGKILDVGSGPGRDGILLKQKGLGVICLDASEAMVKLCIERGLEAIVGDFNKLPFEDKMFDGVWAYTSLLHVPKVEVEKPIIEIRRVLKDNGILGLGFIEGKIEGYRESAGVNKPRWFSFYTKKEIANLLRRSGFEVVYFESFKPKSKNFLNFIARKTLS